MAFHPMRTFQKNRKFWMATILLVCMVTFVLCTGFQGGDFGGWIMNLLGRRPGYAVTTIDGRTIYSQELHELKTRRDIANAYMREAVQLVATQLKHRFDEVGKSTSERNRAQTLIMLERMQREMADKLARQRYFRGGTKLDDLLDFLIWRGQADRLGIRLNDSSVQDLIAHELLSDHPELQRLTRWGPEASGVVQQHVRQNFYGASYRVIVEALTDEFRVHLAQLMLEDSIRSPQAERFVRDPNKLRFEELLETRMAVSPEQMYKYYQKNRNEAEIALIPVRVEKHLNDPAIPKPTDDQLARFFKKYREQKYDPASREPGFQQPELARVRWVTADPKSKFYTSAAQAATVLQITPPFLDQSLPSLPLAAASYAARSAAWEASLARNYESAKNTLGMRDRYRMASRDTPYFALPLYKGVLEPKPADLAALVAATAEPTFAPAAVAGYQAAAYFPQAEELAPVLQYERAKRWPLGSTIVLTAPASPLAAAAMNVYTARPRFLPLVGTVKKEMRDKIEARLAEDWARLNMQEVKTRLEANKGEFALDSALNKLRASSPRFRGGLEEGRTGGWRSPYDIGDDPSMAPLKNSYERYFQIINSSEGRGGTAGMLRPDDFDKLFFGAEPFGVGNILPFDPKPWPPTVTIKPNQIDALIKGRNLRLETRNLFDEAEQPFLFWREQKEESHIPANLDEVRAKVEHAWRLEKSRELMGPKVKAVADRLVKAGKAPDYDPWLAVRDTAKAENEPLTVLRNVAPLVETRQAGQRFGTVVFYEDYQLPRGKILYPRDDMAKQILALRDLKEPIKLGIAEMDKLNKSLFEATKDGGKVIQVLTNKPQTVFYVAVLANPPQARPVGFLDAYRMVGGLPALNLFVDRCQGEFAREYRQELMRQLRAAANMGEISAEARKEFAGDGPNR
jgi:hypothetical protein